MGIDIYVVFKVAIIGLSVFNGSKLLKVLIGNIKKEQESKSKSDYKIMVKPPRRRS